MDLPGGTGLITSALGGLIVAATSWLFSARERNKTAAETEEIKRRFGKIDADIEESKARTAKTKAETLQMMKPQAKAENIEAWGEPPVGWLAGVIEGASDDYVVGVDQLRVHSGTASAYVRAKGERPEGFGALSQLFKAEKYRGVRLRLAGYLRVESVQGWAGLWMRIDGPDGEVQGFDNMQERPVRGTSEWVRREIVLSVPQDAFAIAIGVILIGPGQVWIDDFSLEVVSNDVPTTVLEELLSESPVNLNFEIG